MNNYIKGHFFREMSFFSYKDLNDEIGEIMEDLKA